MHLRRLWLQEKSSTLSLKASLKSLNPQFKIWYVMILVCMAIVVADVELTEFIRLSDDADDDDK